MTRLGLAALVVHVVALAVWLGCVVTAGLAAAITFPTMRSLRPALPDYPGYTGDHWMLAAGKVAARIFAATDAASIGAATLAALSAGVLLGGGRVPWRRWAARAWVVALLAAVGVLAYQITVLRPRMDANLVEYWRAAEAGENVAAEASREAFSAEHPTASNLMGAMAGLALLSLVLAMVAGERPAERRRPDAPAESR
jgi:hypothetical protein